MLDRTTAHLKALFAPKIVLVNHEKRLAVDIPCSNLSIKYNMLYISVYQLIREHIEGDTEWGKQLERSRKNKDVNMQFHQKDDFNEQEFSSVHFDLDIVLGLVNSTIQAKRTSQQFILLEGLCNYQKLVSDEDRFSNRLMDEFFRIEKKVGQVAGVIGLQFESDKEFIDEFDWEDFPEPDAPEEALAKPEGEEGEEVENTSQPPNDDEKKEPSFKPENYKWTKTNKKPMNLPTIYL